MGKEEESSVRVNGVEVVVRRPVENFSLPDNVELTSDSWYEKNKLEILKGITIGSDDLRFNRLIMVSMLSEAWEGSRFTLQNRELGMDDVDNLFLINWLQYWSTFTGLLSANDVRTVRVLSENRQRRMVMKHFSELGKRRYEIRTINEVAADTFELKKSGKLVGIFHGSFDPPTWMHLTVANYYRQYCDYLIIGIDSDEFIQRKGKDRPRYKFAERHAVWSSFENVADAVVEFPDVLTSGGKYDNQKISNYYQQLGVGIVFFDRSQPNRDNRIIAINEGGAIAFDVNPFGDKHFSSTQLMEFKRSSPAWFASHLSDD